MKKNVYWILLLMIMPIVASCSSDDGGEQVTPLNIDQAIGTWMCISSTDSQMGKSYEGLMVGKEVTINSDGTYTSTAPSFGQSGTYKINGNTITAKSSSGTFIMTAKISDDTMTWEGTASNGVTFKYVFKRES